MIKFILTTLVLFTLSTTAHAGEENCAKEKNGEFRALLEQLEKIDLQTAREAINAYGMVSNFETYDDKEPRCTHMDRLLKDMQETIDIYN